MTDKPNILFVQADQLTAFVLSMYGKDAQAKTPNLDALAANGVVMENAYSNSPICCPARASQFTGRLPSTHEVWGNRGGVPVPSCRPSHIFCGPRVMNASCQVSATLLAQTNSMALTAA